MFTMINTLRVNSLFYGISFYSTLFTPPSSPSLSASFSLVLLKHRQPSKPNERKCYWHFTHEIFCYNFIRRSRLEINFFRKLGSAGKNYSTRKFRIFVTTHVGNFFPFVMKNFLRCREPRSLREFKDEKIPFWRIVVKFVWEFDSWKFSKRGVL